MTAGVEEALQSDQVEVVVVVVVAAGSHVPQLSSAEEAEIKDNKETRVALDPRKNDWEGMVLVYQGNERMCKGE